jgi:hypothetical protein
MRASMNIAREKVVPLFAIVCLLIGMSATIYVQASLSSKNTITLNGNDYTVDQLFTLGTTRTITTDDGEKSGIALDDIILKVGIDCPSCHHYIVQAKDGYQQTVNWELMQQGVLTKDSRVYFSHTAHALWVRDVIQIGVS